MAAQIEALLAVAYFDGDAAVLEGFLRLCFGGVYADSGIAGISSQTISYEGELGKVRATINYYSPPVAQMLNLPHGQNVRIYVTGTRDAIGAFLGKAANAGISGILQIATPP